MSDINYNEVFGIEESENIQSVADSDDNTAELEGEKEQNTAESVVSDTQASDIDKEPENNSGESEDSEVKVQSKEENSKFAAARRKAELERDKAIADANAQAQKTIDDAFKSMGLMNPYTQKPITSKAEYDEYKKRFDEERKNSILNKTGMSESELDSFVNSLPAVKQAKEAERQALEAKRQAEESYAKQKLEEEISIIGTYNPDIKSLSDIAKHQSFEKVRDLMNKGYSLVDAYRVANFDDITRGNVAAAKQSAINSARSKQHLVSTSVKGDGGVEVPSDIAEMYKVFNPDVSDAEIRAHFAKQIKK